MSADAEDAKLQASIDAATKSAWKETRPSKFQSRLDKIENTIMNNDPTKSAYYAAGSAFVAENATAVNEVVSTVATAVNFKAIEDGIKTFAETSEVLMKALDAVASIHPVIGVVVLAFKGVVALELKRHSNDRKVIVIQLKMKDMVSVLLDLRGIKDPRHVAPDGKTIEGRMQDLMGRIAKDIDECGNVCETYGKKHVIVKIVKSISWEGKLSSYADTFDQYRKDILLAISIHTTLGVESANIKLDNVGENVRAIEDGMDMMNLLRMLDSPQERDLWKLVKAKGGAKACMENESVLKELVAMVGKKGGDQDAEVDSVMLGEIRKDLKEDIEDALRNNFGIFEKKLVLQQQDFAVKVENVVVRESDRTIATIMAGPHDRVKDKDLHKLWKEMGWKTSVKARHFVLAVHDYFVQKFAVKALEDRLETNTDDGREVAPSVISENPNNSEDDEWAMECITLSRITVMLEAFDDDGSGFISVTEVNEFTSSRPKDWSLLRWLAYWAEGWHYSIWDYRNKVGGIINDMYDLLDEKEMLAENRSLVDRYLSSPGFLSLQRLVKSVIPYTETNTAKLEEKIRPYVTQEEARMRASLEVVDWNIDGPDTLALITGPGRIERYIFPLIYLVLQRHSIILALSCSDIYLEDQLDVPAQTLSKIMDAVQLRMKTILTMLQQRSVDATALLKNVAFGMASIFKILNDPKLEREGEIERILTSDGDEDEVKKVEIQLLESVINFETYESIDQLEFDGDELAANDGSLRGRWTGHTFYDEDGHTDGLAQFHINEVDGDTFGGIGMDKIGRFSLEGEIVSRKDEQEQRIKFTLLYGTQEEPEDETPTLLLIYNGVFSTSSTTVKGTWGVPEEPNLGTFVMTQRPPFAYLFRYNERALAQNAALARWKYALSTVRHQVRKRLWSWSYFQERMLTRRRYIDLRLRTEIANLYSVHPSNELTVEDKEELNRIEQGLSPADSGFYDSLATDIMRKICVHYRTRCDGCRANILGPRLLCLDCVTDDFSNQIDLCELCADRTVSTRQFEHDSSHDSLLLFQMLHYRRKKATVQFAKGNITAAKTVLLKARNPPECIGCGCSTGMPCWHCIDPDCGRETFICAECQRKAMREKKKDWNGAHTSIHSLVWLSPSSAARKKRTVEDRIESLDARLSKDMGEMSQRMEGLEAMVKDYYEIRVKKEVEQMMESYEARVHERIAALEGIVERRLANLEGLLARVLAGVAARDPARGD